MAAGRKLPQVLSLAAILITGLFGTISPVLAQDVSLNYESLSSLEEPLAVEVGDVTLVLTGLLDAPVNFDLEGDQATDADFIGNVQFSARTQLPNRWRIALAYFGQYVSDRAFVSGPDNQYTDNIAFSVGSYWGTVLVGNISGVVREQTRRLRGAGNAMLAFDNVFGGLEDDGGGYFVRFGPWVFSGMMDEDENFDFGAMYQRPTGTRDYRLTARFTDSEHVSADGTQKFSTTAFSGVGEMIYGSTMWDIGAGYEYLDSDNLNVQRWYVSTGMRTKTGILTFSIEGHYGQIESGHEASAALGVQYDLGRGLSANLGLNYAESRVTRGDTRITDTKGRQASFSLRYSF